MKNKTGLLISALMLASMTMFAQTFTNYTTSEGLPSNNINGVTVDLYNNIWFATDEGVAKYDHVSWSYYTTNEGLADNYINCIAVDANNQVWVGTDNGACVFTGSAWITFTSADGLISDMVTCIKGTPDQAVWFGTNAGLSRYIGTVWTSFTSADGLPGNMISCITNDLNNNLWVGTWLGGLAKYDGTSFTVFTTAQQLVDNNILTVAIDKFNHKWIGTLMGISVLDSLDQWKINYTETDGLYNNFIQDLAFDSQDVLWAGIYADYLQDGAVARFNGTGWVNYTIADGLVNAQVKRLAIAAMDHVWIATGNGVSELTYNAGFNELSQPGLKLFPNPVNDILYLDIPVNRMQLKIIDLSGRVLLHQDVAAKENSIDVSTLSPGLYIIQVSNGNSIFNSRFIRH